MNTLKELWKNKRYHSLIVLGLYFIFFVFVFMFFSSMKNYKVPEVEKVGLEYFKDISSYTVLIEGEETFTIDENGTIFYLNQIYTKDNLPTELEKYQTNLNPSIVYQMVQKSTLTSTNYVLNIDIYELDKKSYLEITNENIDNNIILKVLKEEKIKEITIDMDTYTIMMKEN